MRIRRLGIALLALLGPIHAGAQGVSPALSAAETMLFETDHLARIDPPSVLVYAFRKVSNVEPGFSDEVRLDVTGSKGKVSAALHFLSGKNRHELPALDEAHGNPVLLGFLERDIAEMKRLTGGSTAYFRKRLRMALAESASVSPQSITYQGRKLAAQSVRIRPYLDDPMHARFEQYVNKTYTFILSDQVPGGVYQLRSSVVNRAGPPETTVARAAGSAAVRETSASGLATQGAARRDRIANDALAARDVDANETAAARMAQERRQAAGAAPVAPGAAAPVALPEIDETLTLVSVARRAPASMGSSETERKN